MSLLVCPQCPSEQFRLTDCNDPFYSTPEITGTSQSIVSLICPDCGYTKHMYLASDERPVRRMLDAVFLMPAASPRTGEAFNPIERP